MSILSRIFKKDATAVTNRGWFSIVSEPFTGAWQRGKTETTSDSLCYPTLYACLNRVSQDIGKLPFLLKAEDGNGIWKVTANPAYTPVLSRPNGYQTPQQFREAWALSKLQHGNTYVLKERDNRNVVIRLYVLDPARVIPMVTDSGAVYYQLNLTSSQNLLPENYPANQLPVPASEIIHDRLNTFHHQLIGVPPVAAAYWPTVKNLKILKNSAEFFDNAAQPGGILTAPAGMSEADAIEVQKFWQSNYAGDNRGKVAVIGADMKFTSFAVNSADSQLVEQMRYSDEQVCQPFGIPPFKVGIGTIPAGMTVEAINQLYYGDALQAHIQAMEALLTDALNTAPYRVDIDEMQLMRMDSQGKATYHSSLVSGGIEAINEARFDFALDPLEGGDTVFLQQQDFPLDQVRKNKIVDADMNPITEPTIEDPEEELQPDEETKALIMELNRMKALEAVREAINA